MKSQKEESQGFKYSFTKDEDGWRLIKYQVPYEMLSDLSLCNLEYTAEIIENIRLIQQGAEEVYSFGGSDYCIVDVYKEKSVIYYDFGENEIEMNTSEILELMEAWKKFLEEKVT